MAHSGHRPGADAPLTLTIEITTVRAPVCYACDEDATGATDRRKHYAENAVVPACGRHAVYGSRLLVRRVCWVCGGPWTRKSPVDDLDNCVHQRCWDEQNAA
jgi:hypothetical protein